MPDDFSDYAKIEGTKKLQARYGTSQSTIERWRRESGICYAIPNAPKRTIIVARKRVKKKWQTQERIEDLSEFSIWDYRDVLGLSR
jgi:hypothetical protein